MNEMAETRRPTINGRTLGVQRPEWNCRYANQNVVMVCDNSGSMGEEQKAKDATAAIHELNAELAAPQNKDGFSVAVVNFALSSEAHPLTKARALNGKLPVISPGTLGGYTNITAGLEDAQKILEDAERHTVEGIIYLRPVVILFSDGCHHRGPAPHDVANRLKKKADLVTVAFGSNADEKLLRKLASTSQHFYRCSNDRELRSFMAKVGETLTITMAARMNATQALTKMKSQP